ncbi:hypothetical protein THASP1DRAFT_23447 [Thamnocephalis sphaerospora]|uniref:BLOC-1-related complex subunit 5 n=1 Tax=Thamnocephalis sphaerospora TaxID=78915 RepID=A0A4P9XR95_9FUNG|nr:hypothetical protein THASP1DRAFT_23447 [Thamnocephalis sphaerospora]|eukprot:RKP08603.1 hypothetical protein THASP1DRAFT_23447 [Thamnocephalis sphaerospora]
MGRSASHDSHRRTASSSSHRLMRLNPFSSSRSSIESTRTVSELGEAMSMRSNSSNSRLPPVPRGQVARRMQRRGDLPLSTSMPAPRDALDRVAEAADEELVNDEGFGIGDDEDLARYIAPVLQERSRSEGTGIVSVSTARTRREPEEELVRLARIPKFEPLIPHNSTSYFNFGSWLPTASNQSRYVEMDGRSYYDLAIDQQALAGMFLAYQSHQRSLSEAVCTKQREVNASIRSLDESVTRTSQVASSQRQETHKTFLNVSNEVVQLQSQALKTRELIYDIMQTLIKLNEMLPKDDEPTLGSATTRKRYPELSRVYRKVVAGNSANVSVAKEGFLVQKNRPERNSVMLTVDPVLSDMHRGPELSYRAMSPVRSALPSTFSVDALRNTGTFLSFSNGSTSTATSQLQLLQHRGMATSSTLSVATSTLSARQRQQHLQRSPNTPTAPQHNDAGIEGNDVAQSTEPADIDSVLMLGSRPTLPDQTTPRNGTPNASMAVLRPESQTYPQVRLRPQSSLSQQPREVRHSRSTLGDPQRPRGRTVPYDIATGRNSVKRQRARTSVHEGERGSPFSTRTFGSLIRRLQLGLSLSSSNVSGSSHTNTAAAANGVTKNSENQGLGVRGLHGRRRSDRRKGKHRTPSAKSSNADLTSDLYPFAHTTTSVVRCADADSRGDAHAADTTNGTSNAPLAAAVERATPLAGLDDHPKNAGAISPRRVRTRLAASSFGNGKGADWTERTGGETSDGNDSACS